MITRKQGVQHAKFESLWTQEFEEDYPDEDVKHFARHIWLALYHSELGPLLKAGPTYSPAAEEPATVD